MLVIHSAIKRKTDIKTRRLGSQFTTKFYDRIFSIIQTPHLGEI